MSEDWKSIDGFPGYQVSSLGRVQSFKNGDIFGKLLTPSRGSKSRRAIVTLYRNGKKQYRLVARLVCEAFHGSPLTGQQAAHRNGNRLEDTRENLRWRTPKQNSAERDDHGTTARGERHYAAILTDDQVRQIREAYSARKSTGTVYGFITKTAARYNVKISCVEDIVYGRSWKHLKEQA